MAIGPVEYIVVGFPGSEFTGEIAPALAELIEADTIRIIDLVFIQKTAEGDVLAIEYDELEESLGYHTLDGEAGGLLSDDDVALAGEMLEPGSAAALLVWEDRWAAPLAHAMRNSNGVILGGGRIPAEIVEAAMLAFEGDG